MSDDIEVDPKTGFPKLINGSCDGLGCGFTVCWCNEHIEMQEEFQRAFDKPWKDNDVECNIWERSWRFGTKRYENKFVKKIEEMKKEKEMLRDKLTAHIVIYQKETDGALCAKRCEDSAAANAFIRENDLCVDDCKVVGGGWILTRNESKMWFYKRAEQK